MTLKTQNVVYWIVTGLFVLLVLFSGVSGVVPNEQSRQLMQHLGYPLYLLKLLSVAKILAVIAILQPWYRTVKEWAYAGLTFDFICAALAIYLAGDPIVIVAFPMVYQLLLVVQYALWKRHRA